MSRCSRSSTRPPAARLPEAACSVSPTATFQRGKPLNAAELFVTCLENEGVRYVFGVPGEENEDVLFALEGSQIEFVPTRHEQGAAFIANVWGRLTGRAGVCLATLGPGATNLLTGVADANLDKAPLVALTAQGSLTRMHHESHQYINIVQMFRPVTKWNSAVAAPEVISEIVRKAFKVAELEKPGATHIELAEDVAAEQATTKTTPLARRVVRRPAPDYKALDRTVELLSKARRPLFLAGNGAIRKLASKHLTLLAERLEIPVVGTFMGQGALSDRSEQSLFAIGLGFRDYVRQAIDESDLVLTVGYDIAEYPPERWNPDGDKPTVHIDFLPAEVYSSYRPTVEVVSDISAVLWELDRRLEKSEPRFDRDWYRPIRRRILDDLASYDLEPGAKCTVPGALRVIRDLLPDEGLLISDVGSHKMWIARNYPTHCANGCLISNGLASMGIALPGGIAASLVEPKRSIIAAMGDGGFLMNSQELETAQRIGARFVCLVFNDNDYGLINWKQTMSRGRSVSTHIDNPDLVAYAESFGISGYRAQNRGELEAILGQVLETQELCLVEVPIDPSVNLELKQKLDRYWNDQDGSDEGE